MKRLLLLLLASASGLAQQELFLHESCLKVEDWAVKRLLSGGWRGGDRTPIYRGEMFVLTQAVSPAPDMAILKIFFKSTETLCEMWASLEYTDTDGSSYPGDGTVQKQFLQEASSHYAAAPPGGPIVEPPPLAQTTYAVAAPEHTPAYTVEVYQSCPKAESWVRKDLLKNNWLGGDLTPVPAISLQPLGGDQDGAMFTMTRAVPHVAGARASTATVEFSFAPVGPRGSGLCGVGATLEYRVTDGSGDTYPGDGKIETQFLQGLSNYYAAKRTREPWIVTLNRALQQAVDALPADTTVRGGYAKITPKKTPPKNKKKEPPSKQLRGRIHRRQVIMVKVEWTEDLRRQQENKEQL